MTLSLTQKKILNFLNLLFFFKLGAFQFKHFFLNLHLHKIKPFVLIVVTKFQLEL